MKNLNFFSLLSVQSVVATSLLVLVSGCGSGLQPLSVATPKSPNSQSRLLADQAREVEFKADDQLVIGVRELAFQTSPASEAKLNLDIGLSPSRVDLTKAKDEKDAFKNVQALQTIPIDKQTDPQGVSIFSFDVMLKGQALFDAGLKSKVVPGSGPYLEWVISTVDGKIVEVGETDLSTVGHLSFSADVTDAATEKTDKAINVGSAFFRKLIDKHVADYKSKKETTALGAIVQASLLDSGIAESFPEVHAVFPPAGPSFTFVGVHAQFFHAP